MNSIENKNYTYLITGDKHANFSFLSDGALSEYKPEETAVIVVGDFGCNFWLNKTEQRRKKEINDRGYALYLIRGNHEARIQDLPRTEMVYDNNVNGWIYIQPEFPNIRYFKDYGFYTINGYCCYVIGGAYSVDKWYRLERVGLTEETNIPTKSGWFANEQLTEEEMAAAEKEMEALNYNFDFILSHTCPYSLEPLDLFLSGIDQSKVDNSMELWMDKIFEKNRGKFIWLWGHFHQDRVEAPHCEMYYNDIEELKTIAARWKEYDNTGELPWWIVKGPRFHDWEAAFK